MRDIQVCGRPLGADRAYLIAEAGVNHNGDSARARTMIDVAAEAGADCVKFQLFTPRELVRLDAPLARYQAGHGDSQYEMLEELQLDHSAIGDLADYARDAGIDFLCTPFSMEQAAFLVETLGLGTVKVGSGDLTFSQLLRYLGSKSTTVLLSTGMADVGEIQTALRDLEGAQTVLLHCVSQYPAPPDEANLRALDALRDLNGDPVGFSDHFLDDQISLMARAMGALVIERHFTLDKSLPGPDHVASMDPQALKRWVTAIRQAEKSLGDGVKRAMPSEIDTVSVARRSLVVTRDLEPGEAIAEADLTALRPADGISPQLIDQLLGSVVVRPVSEGSALSWEDVGSEGPQ